MTWLVCALLAPALFAVCNIIDKFVLEKHIRDQQGMSIFSGLAGLLAAGGLLMYIGGPPTMDWQHMLLLIVSGMATYLGYVLYFAALAKASAPYVSVLIQGIPGFALVLSVLFLGSGLTVRSSAGFVVIIAALIFFGLTSGDQLNVDSSRRYLRLPGVAWQILAADLCFAASIVVFKTTSEHGHTVESLLLYESVGIALGSVVLAVIYRPVRVAFLEILRTVRPGVTGAIFGNELVSIFAKLISIYAVALGGSVPIVTALGGAQTLWVTVYSGLLAVTFQNSFSWKGGWRAVLRVVACGAVLIFGIWLSV